MTDKNKTQEILNEQTKKMDGLVAKWEKLIEAKGTGAPTLKRTHDKRVIAQLLENQTLNESTPGTTTASQAVWNPVMISMVRRAIPQTIAFDVLGVQPMNMPTGLVFALKARYEKGTTDSREALFNEAETNFSGTGTHKDINDVDITGNDLIKETGEGFETELGELLSTDAENSPGKIKRMGLTIEKIMVEAKTRKLNAQYSIELAQDLQSVHNLDANAEMTNILAREIIAEENREVFRKMYGIAVIGAQDCTKKGEFNLDKDADGRWSVEKYKGLLYQIEKEANAIMIRTKRGRGNFIICTANVASMLQNTGFLDTSDLSKSSDLVIDTTVSTFAGVLHGRYKVYVDPFISGNFDFILVGYRGESPLDAGMFYCPYIPLQYFEQRDIDNFQPIIGFQTRYGICQNPLAGASVNDYSQWTAHKNDFYRIFKVTGLGAGA